MFDESSYLVSGSPYTRNGKISFRLGTYVITETKAPNGYINEGEKFVVTVQQDNNDTKVEYRDANGNVLQGSQIEVGNDLKTVIKLIEEPVKRGGLTGSKVLLETGDNELGDIDLTGIKFAVVTNNPGKVVVNGKTYTNGQVVAIFSTDSKGDFTSANDLLPYGNYTLVELRRDSGVVLSSTYTSANKGSSKYASPDQDSVIWKEQNIAFSIENDRVIVTVGNTNSNKDIGNNDSKGSGIIQKTDSENTTKQGDANLSGIKYIVVNNSVNKVKYNGKTYDPGFIIDILVTNATGKVSTADLDYGTYLVVEAHRDTTLKIGDRYDETKLGTSIYANDNGYLYKAFEKTIVIDYDGKVVDLTNDDPVVKGSISLVKVDRDNGKQVAQGDGSIAHIFFAIVNRSAEEVVYNGKTFEPGTIIDIFETDEKGTWSTAEEVIPYGTYDVVELREDATFVPGDTYSSNGAKAGNSIYANKDHSYQFEANMKQVTIREQNENVEVKFSDPITRGSSSIQKLDKDFGTATYQGDATFAGIQYAIVNRSDEAVYVGGVEYAPGQTVMILTLDASGKASTGARALPYGTYDVIELRVDNTVKVGTEFKDTQIGTSIYANNNGYLYVAQTKELVVREENKNYPFEFTDPVVRATISVTKYDAETGEQKPQGVGSFANIRYAIVNRSKMPVYLDGQTYAVGEIVEILITDETGYAKSSMIPYGTYDVVELRKDSTFRPHDVYSATDSKAGKSIYANDTYLYTDHINDVNVKDYKTYTVTVKKPVLREQEREYNNKYSNFPVRGDMEQYKFDIDGYKVPYIPFLVSLVDADGNKIESHVILTDASGNINTQTRLNKDASKVNSLDKYVSHGKYTGPLDDAAASVNIWFGSLNFVMNSRGALLYGNYIVEELQCENNLGQDLLKHELAVYEEFEVFKPENVAINLNVIIESTAKDILSDSNSISLGKEVEVSDTIQFTHLKIYNKYEVVTELVNVLKNGQVVVIGRSEPVEIVPDKFDDTNTSYATIENPIVNKFTVDTSTLEPGSYVAFVDYLYYVNDEGDRLLIKTHNEFYDVESQMLLVPEVTSQAHNDTTKNRVGSLKPNSVIYDTVNFKNLGDKVFYRMIEELFYEDGTPVLDKNGNVCKAEIRVYVDYRFDRTEWRDGTIVTGPDGSFDMPMFELDSVAMAGKTITIRQSLLDEVFEQVVLVHNSNLDVEDQTIRWMDISTTAKSETGVQGIIPCDEVVKLIDKVDYTNLAEDVNVRVETVVVDVETGEEILVKSTNKSLTTGSGTFDIEMTLDTLEYAGHRFVVYEYIYLNVDGSEVLIAEHEDINDEAQIVMIPEIHTTLESVIDGVRYKSIDDCGTITLVDTVTYKNLKVGETYTFEATLMNKRTGEPVLDKDGKVVTGTTTYVPTATEGTVEVEIVFEVDGSLISEWDNRDAFVAFEEVWSGGLRYAFHKDLEDEDQTVVVPKIRTQALGKDSESKNVISKDGQTVVDTVELKDFYVGDTLTLVIEAHDPVTGEYLGFTASKTFVYEGQQFETIECVIDASELGGKNVVFYEFVHVGEVKDETVIAHEDVADNFDQTIRIPTGSTLAFETETKLHLAKAVEEMHITDIVTYKNIEPNREYILKSDLVDKDTGDVIASVENKLTLESVDGKITVDFVFDGSELAGKTLVVFETITELNGVAIFEHKDINDEDQSVHIPEIKTDAVAQDTTEKVTGAKTETVIVDTVSYKNLIADGREYVMTGYLVNKDNGNPILIDGEKIMSSVTFVPEAPDGEVEIVFTFDGSALAGTTVVVYEDLYVEDVNIATHADIEDVAQTVYIPKISTKVFDENTLVNHSKKTGTITVIDTVEYTHLLPGKEYTVTGKLIDKNTGEPLLVNGEEVTSSTTFTPETTDGTVEVKFTFDASAIERTTLIVFETLFYNDIEIASHADIEDEDQTDYIPVIGTSAVDSETGEHISSTKEVTIVDTVSYEGLKPNTRYEMVGKLMDKATGEPLLVNGEEVTASVTFVTGDADEGKTDVSGTVDIEFTFDASELAGKTIVVFESLMYEDVEVAIHADIEDEAQTVHFPEIHTNASDKEDGDQVIDGTQTKQTIVDRVTYKNLIPGLTYKMVGTLVVKQTGELVRDADGNVLTVELEFVPEEADGYVELEFEVDATKYAGKKLVAFESLMLEDVELTAHADIEDPDQTINVTLLLDVRIAKADKDKINYYLKGAEITVFNADGTIAKDVNGNDCVGITDENGQVAFMLLYDEDNIYYVQETKAPAGYNINPDKFEVTLTGEDKLGVDLIAINILDEALIIPPQTGDNSNLALWFGLMGLSLLGLIAMTVVYRRKSKYEVQ